MDLLYKKINAKITIAHVVYSFGTGGIENGIVNIINNMNNEKYFHVICCLTTTGNFQDRLIYNNYIIYSLNKKSGNDIIVPINLVKIFRSHNVNIVHLRGWPTLIEGVISAMISRAKAIIFGFHGKTANEVNGSSFIRKYSEKLALKFVDKIITLSDIMKSEYSKYLGINENLINVIYNGVDTNKFKHVPERDNIRFDLGINNFDIVIGSIGRIDPVKDFDTLLRSFKKISDNYNNVKLIIVGDGTELPRLKKLAFDFDINESTIFTGHRDDIQNILNVIDIYAQTSIYEGFSNTILEAMATSLPIVATNVGGNAFIVKDGKNGFLVEVGMDDQLCEKLSILISNAELRKNFGRLSRAIVLEKFSINKTVDDYDRFYLNLFNQNSVKSLLRKK